MSNTGQWGAGVRVPSPGWMDVPAELTGDALDAWVGASTASLRELWAADWREGFADEVAHLLRQAATRPRDGKILDLLHWPIPGPVVVRVSVRVLPSMPLSNWVQEGFEIDAFDSSDLGPGVRCIARADVPDGEQHRTAITAHYVFDDGTHMVQVEVEPTLIELFSHALVELSRLLSGLQVRRGDGAPFVPRPVPGLTLAEVDTFSGNNNGF